MITLMTTLVTTTRTARRHIMFALLMAAMAFLFACDDAKVSSSAQADAQLQSRIETVLASTPDVPPALRVAVSDGRVTISGSLACEDCGGRQTPAANGTIQQSIGAIVRAVPGVMDVEFVLTTQS